MAGPLVVKFGGSLIDSRELGALLVVVSRAGAIVAPGGGPFADAVRDAQSRTGFSDDAAHAMAILAMDQTALLLHDAAPTLQLCTTPDDFAAAHARGRGAIWRPSPMALGADLPRSWDVTSDSLAIWLAIELRAPRVLILKAADVAPGSDLGTLAAAQVVDPYAPRLAQLYPGTIEVLGPASVSVLSAALAAAARRAA